MARIEKKSVVLSAVALAVALALYAPCHSFANDDTESFNVKTEVKETTAQRHLRLTSSLATDTVMVMQEDSSQKCSFNESKFKFDITAALSFIVRNKADIDA